MNTLHFHGFSAVDMDMLMALCSEMKCKDSELVTFDFSNLRKIMKYNSNDNGRFVDDLKRMNDKLMKVTAHFIVDKKEVFFVLFPTFTIDQKEQKLTVRVNPDFKYLLNEIGKQFTIFELTEFVSLSGKYSKNLYRLLKQYRNTGIYRIDATEFQKRMDIPNELEKKYHMRNCIKPAMEELRKIDSFQDLKIEPIKAHKKGAPVTAYEFTFSKEEKKLPKKKKNNFNIGDLKQNYDIDELEKQLEKQLDEQLKGD